MRRRFTLAIALFCATATLASAPAAAQRRIIGGGDREKQIEEEKAKKEAEAKRKAEEKARKEAEAKKRAAERRKKLEAKRKAEEAARKAAKEAEKKRKAEEERKKQAAIEAEKQRLEENRAERLQAAKKQRKITRRAGDLAFTVTLVPGAPKPNEVLELRVDVARELEVADVRYGKFKPLRGLEMITQVSPPDTGLDEEPIRYRVHELRAPGAYGVHLTTKREGAHPIRIEGERKKGPPFTVDFVVHSGEWPPPDFDAEEENNAKLDVSASGRRVAGGG